jgi:hypothetical protein
MRGCFHEESGRRTREVNSRELFWPAAALDEAALST